MSRSAEAARQRERANRLAIERAKHGERKSPAPPSCGHLPGQSLNCPSCRRFRRASE